MTSISFGALRPQSRGTLACGWTLTILAAALPAAQAQTATTATASNAAGDSSDLPPVVITGTRTPRTLGGSIASTSVVTRQQIERSGVRDLVSALELMGTVSIEQTGGPGSVTSVRLRGADTRDTLVLIDGVPITDVTTGAASIQQIPAEWIERIEVVRGNLSALYGANATGGVVQIFTRRAAKGFAAQAAVGMGQYGASLASFNLGGGGDVARVRVAGGAERTSGISAINPDIKPNANADRDGNRRRNATLGLDLNLGEGQSASLDFREVIGRNDYDDGSSFSAPADLHWQDSKQRFQSVAGKHALAGRWTLDWRAANTEETRDNMSITSFGPSSFGNTLHTGIAMVNLQGDLGGGLSVQSGVERLDQSTDNTTYVRQNRVTNTARAGVSLDQAWGGLQANYRHDDTSDFGAVDTGLLGARAKLGNGFSALAHWSSSFTPPTLDFLFYDCSPWMFVCNNPNLKPERSRNTEISLQWESDDAGRFMVRGTLFRARYTDKIANDADGIPQNIGRASDEGLELVARGSMGPWRINGAWIVQNPVNQDTGAVLLRRPHSQFTLRGEYVQSNWSAGASLRRVGLRVDSAGEPLPAYAVLDLSARWAFSQTWAVQARLDNAFNAHYQPTVGYNGLPRTWFLTLHAQLASL